MATLAKRATPSQAMMMRMIEGAVRNTAHAHPDWIVHPRIANSIAKRAAGTLSAQLADVLAVRSVPSEIAGDTLLRQRSPASRGSNSPVMSSEDSPNQARQRGPASLYARRSPLSKLWSKVSIMIGEARRAGDIIRMGALIDVARMIAAMQEKK